MWSDKTCSKNVGYMNQHNLHRRKIENTYAICENWPICLTGNYWKDCWIWIDRASRSHQRPSWSQHLNTLDFLYWCYLKDVIYFKTIANLTVFRQGFTKATDDICFRNAKRLAKRSRKCTNIDFGKYFKLLPQII